MPQRSVLILLAKSGAIFNRDRRCGILRMERARVHRLSLSELSKPRQMPVIQRHKHCTVVGKPLWFCPGLYPRQVLV